MKFEIHKSKWRQRFWVRIVASNGQVLFTSEMYAREEDALRAANIVELDAARARYEDLT